MIEHLLKSLGLDPNTLMQHAQAMLETFKKTTEHFDKRLQNIDDRLAAIENALAIKRQDENMLALIEQKDNSDV